MADIASPNVIAITGASSGLGKALALEYASKGVTLLLHGRDIERLQRVTTQCELRGARVLKCAADLQTVEEFMQRFGELLNASPPDLLIVNAGITNAADSDGEQWADISRVIDINLRGALATVATALPVFRERKREQIALISSLAAYTGMPVTPTYAATKAALSNYGDALRALLAPQGISLSVVMPGFIDTPMTTRFPAGKPMMQSATAAAHRIRVGLARNQARISFPWGLSLGMRLLSMLPTDVEQRFLRWLGFGL
jgi:short-subunit dehydrogenase